MIKTFFTSIVALYFAVLMVSCSKDSDNGGGYPYGGGACPIGTMWNGYSCTPSNPGYPMPGGYPNGFPPAAQTTTRFYDYNRFFYTNGWSMGTQNGDMTITNTAAYKQFLKEAMAICDRNIWGWEAGLADCSSWVSGSFQLEFAIDNSLRPLVSFTAYPAPNFYSYFVSAGIDAGGVAYNPLVLGSNTTFSLINNSKGFEIRAQGSYTNGGGLRLIQIQVINGTLNDGYFNYDLYYPFNNVPTKIATGKFKRR